MPSQETKLGTQWHFIKDLMPAVEATKEADEDGNVMSVLAAGWGCKIDP
jgi:hypothetical protein